jgi:uncharacterized protein YbjT (DUF2867 family)
MNIAITTPTGHIGSRLVRLLLDAGADLTLLLRNPDKLDASLRERVNIQQGEQQDRDFVQRATQGADALFWVTPNDMTVSDLRAWYDRLGESAAAAVEANRIPYVVNLSSAGAQLPNAGPISGLGLVEQHLNKTDANLVHLRPGFFMENTLQHLETIRHQNAFFQPSPGDVPAPHIATHDIADVAAKLLLQRDWSGKRIRGLHGPADLTYNEIARILSEATGRTINYVTISPEETRQIYLGLGFSPAIVQGYLDMDAAASQPGAIAEPRTPETTTPTTFHQWAREELKPLLNDAR